MGIQQDLINLCNKHLFLTFALFRRYVDVMIFILDFRLLHI